MDCHQLKQARVPGVVVSEVLYYVWDPIGVADFPGPRDEYDAYVAQVLELLQSGVETAAVANELEALAHDKMGLSSDIVRAKSERAARILTTWSRYWDEPR